MTGSVRLWGSNPVSDFTMSELYRERAALLAHLATVYPSHVQYNGDEPGYASLYISLPTGQTAWYIADADMDLFTHVRTDLLETWDGHTVEERQERLDHATRIRAAGGWVG